MPPRDPSLILEEILEAISRIKSYTSDGESAFRESTMVQDAVVRQLEVIGEAVRGIPPTALERAPEIQWPRIIGMRNLLTHAYFEIDLDIVWDTVVNDLDPLESVVRTLLEEGL